jgi:hypothetical protein
MTRYHVLRYRIEFVIDAFTTFALPSGADDGEQDGGRAQRLVEVLAMSRSTMRWIIAFEFERR